MWQYTKEGGYDYDGAFLNLICSCSDQLTLPAVVIPQAMILLINILFMEKKSSLKKKLKRG